MGFFDDRERGDLGPPPEPFRIGGGTPEFRSPVPLRWIGIAAAILVGFIVLSVVKSIYVDVLWFDSVGFESVFRRVLYARIILFFVGAGITVAVIGANIYLARRFAPRGPEESFIEEVDVVALRRIVAVVLVAGTIFLGVIFGSVAGGSWETILTWLNGVDFGRSDPAFDRDISFYMFDLPAYELIQGWFLGLLIVSTLASGAVYALSLSLQGFELNVTRGMRVHLSVLLGLILLLIALSTYLSIFNLVLSQNGIVFGATYTDVNARLPVRYILIALALFAGLATIANAFLSRDSYRLPLFAFGLWAVTGLVGSIVYPNFVQSFQVDPNEREREEQFIARNIDATRFAYGLNEIVQSNFPALQSVTQEEMEASPQTIDNIRLLDPRPLRETYNQVQAIRQFYVFNDIDVDRYVLDGELRQVMISARELDVNRAQERNWTRERLQLTHGFGAVVAPVNRVLAEGLPDFITEDIPPVSEQLPLSIEGSRIYFGESTNHYVIVNSNEPEFDYPVGEGNAETFYEPDRGIGLSSFARRFALAWEMGDTNLLISGQITSDARLLIHRNIRDRITKVAPFLVLDRDPYMVVIDGQIVWIQSAYTTSDRFPYSQPSGGSVNYIRDSVKVVVDAITGDMTFYLIDPDDPLSATWAKIFPDLFTPDSEMPQAIRDHLRYPLDMFSLQAELYLRYHITDPDVFFIGEDVWNIPTERFGAQEQPVEPYYVLMTLPNEDLDAAEQLEFALIMPFTPRTRQNTVAWLAGRSDGESYGALRAYRFPTDDLVFGPSQIEARIDQNPGISQQISLWNQSGSDVIRGNLLMIPIGQSFLFVEPIYLQAENSRLPELVRVVVANGNAIAMEPTLDRALDVIFGRALSSLPGSGAATPTESPTTEPTPTPTRPPLDDVDLQRLLQEARDAASDAQAELNRLQELLDEIEDRQSSGN